MGTLRNYIIKSLGGYTKKEYQRLEQKYQGLLDSKTDNTSTYIANEYMMRILKDLDTFAKSLFGSSLWASRMYHVIHNNFLRIMIRYVHSKSNCIYKLDTTLDSPDEFINVLKQDNDTSGLWILDNEDWEV